ncbi:unnamed protein product [Victoria cruziana]
MANKVSAATFFIFFLLFASSKYNHLFHACTSCMGANTHQEGSVCCTNPYTGCHKGNKADEGRCNSFCTGKGCRGGECKRWGNPAGQCHCYC